MSSLEKLYTVEEIAQMASLTTRTIRNYLRDGILTGRKIGGQWRFTTEDLQKFMNRGEVRSDMAKEQRQEVVDFIDGVNTDVKGNIQICTIIDLYTEQNAAKEKSDVLCKLINETKGETYLKYTYNYAEPEGKARYILFASPNFIVKAIGILK